MATHRIRTRTLEPAEARLGCIDFSSNDYLGLANHPVLLQSAENAIARYGIGSTGSRLLSGDRAEFHQLESEFAAFKAHEAALFFNSGYHANVGVIPVLAGPGDAVFADRLVHASMIDGIRLSGARFFRYRHNEVSHLESLLAQHRGAFQKAWILTESVFSMEGDRAPLSELVRVKTNWDCGLMVDEAHATGLMGATGAGLVEAAGLSGQVDVVMSTFSKALGSVGAGVACSQALKDRLINQCRSLIYSTVLPPLLAAVNRSALQWVSETADAAQARIYVQEIAQYLRDQVRSHTAFSTLGSTQIVPILISKDESETMKASAALRTKGLIVSAIRPPTVPPGTSRLRVSVTAQHTPATIDQLVQVLGECL